MHAPKTARKDEHSTRTTSTIHRTLLWARNRHSTSLVEVEIVDGRTHAVVYPTHTDRNDGKYTKRHPLVFWEIVAVSRDGTRNILAEEAAYAAGDARAAALRLCEQHPEAEVYTRFVGGSDFKDGAPVYYRGP